MADKTQDVIILEAGRVWYGFDARQVEELISLPALSWLPLAPENVLGMTDYKNQVLPVYSFPDICGVTAGKMDFCLILKQNLDMYGLAADKVLGMASLEAATKLQNPGIANLDFLKIKAVYQLAKPVILLEA